MLPRQPLAARSSSLAEIKKGTAHALTDSGFCDLREQACRSARGEVSGPGSCIDRRFKDERLLFLRSGTVEVVKDGVQIASVNAPGSVFGELAVLLDQPYTADVRTLEPAEFYVADAPAILASDPAVALYVAAILARQTGEPASEIGKAMERVEELLSYGGRDPTGW